MPIRKLGYMFLLLDSLALAGIGFFTLDEATHAIHFTFSITFFVLVLLAYITMGISMVRDEEFRSLGIAGAFAWAYMWNWEGWAIPEAVKVFPAAL